MTSKNILVTGATGKQGGAVIDALLESKGQFQILALTRNASSAKAQSLASRPNITVVVGNPAKPAPIFDAHKSIYGVFSVTMVGGKEGQEEAQAYQLIDESVKNGVEHFVFTSVDRGGPGRSEQNITNIPHFASKHRIEEYLKEKTKDGKMKWTLLRPVAFMDNLTPDFMGKGFTSMWAGVGNKPLQLVSCRDIGLFAARAFNNPSAYTNKAVSLAGDELTFEQGKKVFKDTLGYNIPETYSFVGSAIKWSSKEMGTMFKWFGEEGYGANIPELRKEEPRLQNLSQWLKESSGFQKK